MSEQLRIVHEREIAFEISDLLFRSAIDAPVFYSSGMLRTWITVTGGSFELAVLEKNNIPLIALPMICGKYRENVTYPGWDNLNALVHREATIDDEQRFWTGLVRHYKRVILHEITQRHFDFSALQDAMIIRVAKRKCPYINLAGGWEKLHQEVGKKLVRNIRQYGNKAKEAGITFSVFPSKRIALQERINGLETAAGFHKVRMHALKQESKFTPEAFAAYHKTVLDNAENCVIIQAKNSQGAYIAWYYGLINKRRFSWFNGGYHPDYLQYSIGTLLVANLIDFALENGLALFDFLRGNEEYKQKWTKAFDTNETVYLAQTDMKNAFLLLAKFFTDTRKRLGSSKALKMVSNVLKADGNEFVFLK
jgi:hypothetical protein